MTEAEVIESTFNMGGLAVAMFGIYISVIFAYLATAYFVGKDLTTLQVSVVSGPFIAAETMATATISGCILGWEKLIDLHPSVLDTIPFFTIGVWHLYMAVLLTIGVGVGLYFMYDIRRTSA